MDNFNVDIWNDLFDRASDTESKNSSGLIPFWGLKEYFDNLKIERIFPMYPYSIDKIKYDRLIEILSLYRLTLGQPRQEELVEKIMDNENIDKKELNELFINLSPFYRDR